MTPREDIITMRKARLSTFEIARQLGLARNTVRRHLKEAGVETFRSSDWQDWQNDILDKAIAEGLPNSKIAELVGKTDRAVRHRRQAIGRPSKRRDAKPASERLPREITPTGDHDAYAAILNAHGGFTDLAGALLQVAERIAA